jgi:hypothetical protein
MKAILEFNLPADEQRFNIASKAMDWSLLVWDLQEQLRKWEKYGEHTEEEIALINNIQQFICARMEDKGLIYPE